MQSDSTQPRPRGTGSLLRHADRAGGESWYGKWRTDGRQVMRKLGPVRDPRSRTGLTRLQAEAALRQQIEQTRSLRRRPGAQGATTLTVGEAGRRYIAHKETIGLKRSTLCDYESSLRVHLAPFFAGRPLERIDVELIEAFMAAKRQQGKAPKSILNYVGLLHAIYGHACRRGWCQRNPVADVEKPRHERHDPDIRFLTLEELEDLLRAVPDSELGRTERAIYLAAALSGARRGELIALRWMDVDWDAGLLRVRRNYTRGEFGTPKSRRSSRAIPLAARLHAELRAHQTRSVHTGELDLVFCHPTSGRILDPSMLLKRFKAAAARAALRPVRFHDLRHTFGTRMAAAGAPLRAVQEWMGHSDYRTTSLYADYAPDLSQAAHWASRAFPPSDLEDK